MAVMIAFLSPLIRIAYRFHNFRFGVTVFHPHYGGVENGYNVVCASGRKSLLQEEFRAFACSAIGRYVFVQLLGYNILNLCELEVYGM